MLCSHCSRVVRPVVAIDIDGTIGDYHTWFLSFAEQWLGVERQHWDYHGIESFGDWFCDRYGADKTTYRQIKLAYRQGGMKRSMPVYSGMIDLVRNTKAIAEVWLTTTRPYLRLDTVDPDTRFWLDKHRIPFDGLLYDEQKYARLAELVDPERVVAIVDDLAEMYDAARELYGVEVPILNTTYWNSAVSRRNEGSGDYINNMVRERINAWETAWGEVTK